MLLRNQIETRWPRIAYENHEVRSCPLTPLDLPAKEDDQSPRSAVPSFDLLAPYVGHTGRRGTTGARRDIQSQSALKWMRVHDVP
jgi:hypothetical protein